MTKAVQDIGSKHQLHIDQMGALEGEVAAAMIGVTKLEDLTANIAEALSIEEQKASEIAKSVNEDIFIKIRESVKLSTTPPAKPTPEPSVPAAVLTSTVPSQSLSKPTPQTIDIHAETILTQPTASVAPAPKPQEKPIVKVDPYREPVE